MVFGFVFFLFFFLFEKRTLIIIFLLVYGYANCFVLILRTIIYSQWKENGFFPLFFVFVFMWSSWRIKNQESKKRNTTILIKEKHDTDSILNGRRTKKELSCQKFGFANVQNMKTKFVVLKRANREIKKNHLQFIVDVLSVGTCTEFIKQFSRFTLASIWVTIIVCILFYIQRAHTHHSCIDSINNSVVALL